MGVTYFASRAVLTTHRLRKVGYCDISILDYSILTRSISFLSIPSYFVMKGTFEILPDLSCAGAIGISMFLAGKTSSPT